MKTRYILKIILLFLATVFLYCDTVRPFIISDEQEITIGNNLKKQISADTENYPPFKGDYRVIRFVDSIGSLLTENQNERPTLRFTFTILKDDSSVNAFAIPGGHVFVYTGLLREAENAAELAGVIAHEIGHITRYHGADRLVAGEVSGLVNQILFGDESSIVKAAASLLENLAFLKFSRKNEFEADSCAVVYTSRTGINPLGVRDFFVKLKSRYGDSQKIFEPISSHPLLSERIEQIDKVIQKNGWLVSDTTSFFREEYLQIKNLLNQ